MAFSFHGKLNIKLWLQRREIPWEKVPCVPRPSLVADPITAFGKRKPKTGQDKTNILERINRDTIKPAPQSSLRPLQPYVSARDMTRERVFKEMGRQAEIREGGGSLAASTDKYSMDVVLPRLHRTAPIKEPHRQVFFVGNY